MMSPLASQIRMKRCSSRASKQVVCSALAARPIPRIRVAFQLPFRVRFGQSLRLVGSGLLGDWDLQRSVPMKWSDGDIWKAELELDLCEGDSLQYKYIVSNPDGGIAAWKPGENICLDLPSSKELDSDKEMTVRILDTWDGTIHEVQLDTILNQEDCRTERENQADQFIQKTLQKCYEDLESKLNLAQGLVDSLDDPGAKEMILADRELAIAANKASALAKVVEAASQQAHFKNTPL